MSELFNTDSMAFQWAVIWIPDDYWSNSNLKSIKQVIDERIKDRIVNYLTEEMTGKVNLSIPDRIIWVDVVGRQAELFL